MRCNECPSRFTIPQGVGGIDGLEASAHNDLTPPAHGQPMKAGKIFINYRREDSRADAGRLYDRLQALYPERVFRDVGSLEPGIEWREAIDKVLGDADACIVVIGKNWLTMPDAAGKRRLDDPKDTVRQELQTALKSGMRVFPILVGGAKMPPEEELPAELQALARRNALEVSEQDWNEDFEKLVKALERTLGWSPSTPAKGKSRTGLYAIGGTVAALVVVGIVVAMYSSGETVKTEDTKVVPGPGVDVVDRPQAPVAAAAPTVVPPVKPPVPEAAPLPTPVRKNPTPSREVPREAVSAPVVTPPPPPRRPSNAENAQDALSAGHLVTPRNDSALHWALQAQQANEPGALNVLDRINDAILNHLKTLTNEKRFDEELTFLNAYAEYYPANSPMQRTIQQVRDQIRQAQQGVRLQVIHRHGIDYRTARCEGWLEIDPAGTVSYACDPRFVHDSRCDRATFPSGTFTYKTVSDPEQLHLTTASGNFDFFAAQPTIAASIRALAAAGAKIQQK